MKLDDEACFLIRRILLKLYNLRIFGGKHKSVIRVYRSVPSHLRGQAKNIVKLLIKKQILTPKGTVGDMHIRLNTAKLSQIESICKAQTANEIRSILEPS